MSSPRWSSAAPRSSVAKARSSAPSWVSSSPRSCRPVSSSSASRRSGRASPSASSSWPPCTSTSPAAPPPCEGRSRVTRSSPSSDPTSEGTTMNSKTLVRATVGMAVLALPLAACSSSKPAAVSTSAAAGSSASANAPAATSITAPTKAKKNYNIQFIQGVAGDQFYITMQCGAQAEAAKLGVTVKTQGPQKFDPTLQKPILDSVVATKPDAIMIAPTDVTAMQGPLQAAASSGIKVILVDTTTKDPSYAASAIASDNEAGGKAAFEALKVLNPNGGKVMMMSVDPGISTTDARAKGFEDAVKADPKFDYVGIQYSHDDPATASNLMGSTLQKYPDLVGVFATNLFAAEGSANGVKQAGKTDTVKIVSFDAGPNQVKDLNAGTIQALVAQEPGTIGQYGVDMAVAALDGGTVTPKVQTGS